MAYGQTGSGKTYTMLGPKLENSFRFSVEDETELGIIPRASKEVFRYWLYWTSVAMHVCISVFFQKKLSAYYHKSLKVAVPIRETRSVQGEGGQTDDPNNAFFKKLNKIHVSKGYCNRLFFFNRFKSGNFPEFFGRLLQNIKAFLRKLLWCNHQPDDRWTSLIHLLYWILVFPQSIVKRANHLSGTWIVPVAYNFNNCEPPFREYESGHLTLISTLR